MHCASKLDTNNRGVGASKVDAAAQDGVGSSTPGNPRASGSTPKIDDAAQNGVDPGASELSAAIGVTASELCATVGDTVQARSTRE